ncbi:hypothetical protein K443DRAFT_15239 [Laccaria amethystina LaAM-08-1]|uniref:Unplaced genomic scaffold K443scaffold_652, whole genome shotgun sequence n=1 Tax=Laccaria amethystina LaAM-08-1 TaxID=1095629 RepID=A0A0C9WYJ6_9AGAR|nr:hypothetical protein K443DRAFT_15238 [Laccaria amethystina LaAM-08-1]KIJ90441.1 hypothetical protein K443DRAFT_15239 [Laccaria amethystina LaAM-08-1]
MVSFPTNNDADDNDNNGNTKKGNGGEVPSDARDRDPEHLGNGVEHPQDAILQWRHKEGQRRWRPTNGTTTKWLTWHAGATSMVSFLDD